MTNYSFKEKITNLSIAQQMSKKERQSVLKRVWRNRFRFLNRTQIGINRYETVSSGKNDTDILKLG